MYFITASDKNISVVDAAGHWSFLPLPTAALPFESFTDILVQTDEDIWLASGSGLYHYAGSAWAFLDLGPCRSLAVDTQGKIYARASASIYIIDNGTVSAYHAGNSPLSTAIITGHGVDANDNLWIAESDLWEPDGQTFIHKVAPDGVWTTYSVATYPVISKVNGDFHFDRNGHVWIPGYLYGAVKFDGTTFSNPFTGNLDLFANYNASSIASDADGKVYFSHQYGVTTLFNGEWEDLLIADVPNRSSSIESKIKFDDAGNLWWASRGYGVFAYPTGITSTTLSGFEPSTHFAIYPNPAPRQVTLSFTLPATAKVKALLYNSLGQLITQLDWGQLPAGNFQETIPVADLPKGLYFLQLHVAGQAATQLLVVQ
jgi:ligand-binding sensor domain-containing protein